MKSLRRKLEYVADKIGEKIRSPQGTHVIHRWTQCASGICTNIMPLDVSQSVLA